SKESCDPSHEIRDIPSHYNVDLRPRETTAGNAHLVIANLGMIDGLQCRRICSRTRTLLINGANTGGIIRSVICIYGSKPCHGQVDKCDRNEYDYWKRNCRFCEFIRAF